jgi:ATP-dependent Clp protease adaptor protein ClpS
VGVFSRKQRSAPAPSLHPGSRFRGSPALAASRVAAPGPSALRARALSRYTSSCTGTGRSEVHAMSQTVVAPRTKARPKTRTKTQRPPLYKVILLNDDYTPREFVVVVLKAVFRMNAEHAWHVMMTAHLKGACVIAVYARDVAETKAKEATEMGKREGYPLFFTTEPEE